MTIAFVSLNFIACHNTKSRTHTQIQPQIVLNMIYFELPKNLKKTKDIDSIPINILRMNLTFDRRYNDSIIYFYNKADSAGFIFSIYPNRDSIDNKHILREFEKYDSTIKNNILNFELLNRSIKEFNNIKYIINEYTNNKDLHKYGYNRAIWNYTLSACYIPNKKQIIGFYFVSCSKKYPAFRTDAYHVLETLEIKDNAKSPSNL